MHFNEWMNEINLNEIKVNIVSMYSWVKLINQLIKKKQFKLITSNECIWMN